MRLKRWIHGKLHRRIFVWFGASIIATAGTVALVLTLVTHDQEGSFGREIHRVRTFVSREYARVWNDVDGREELTLRIAQSLELGVHVQDAHGHLVASQGPRCPRHELVSDVRAGGERLGTVHICAQRHRGKNGWLFLIAGAVACGTLWGFSGIIARRIARPLEYVARVAREIGSGDLSSRVGKGRARHPMIGEIAVLADSIDDMATRIEKQLRDQKELLAAVSHEIRTPLGHIRILVDRMRDASDKGAAAKSQHLDELEREVLEIDDLVGELLASSRLSFDSIETRTLEALDLGVRALERAGLSLSLLESSSESIPFSGDATLLGRALSNLIENAKRHGGGLLRLRIDREGERVVFVAEDRGEGISSSDLERVFESFYRGERSAGAASLGLGLSLVRRIAVAHGGEARAENRPEGGASVSFSVRA